MPQTISALELHDAARRHLSRKYLLDFCRYTDAGFIVGHPQRVLAELLEKVESGELKRLLVSMPPRHGKSRMITQMFPCWYLGRHPEAEIIQTTYAHPLSVKHSRQARDIFTSNEYAELFPDTRYVPSREAQGAIAIARQAADEWGTQQGGQYYAVGVGGSVTGHGADIAIMDDPIKNREEANSATIREKTWDFYRSTLYTRLSPDGALIVLMTRWHPDDPAGRILEQMRSGETGEEWTVVNLPAWDETETEALWPERWPLDKLQGIRDALGQYEWNSLYMGQPVVRGGNMIKADRIMFHDNLDTFPDSGYVRAWDLASTEKERGKNDPDFTAGALLALTQGVDGQEYVYLKDMVYGQWGAQARDNAIVETAKRDGEGVAIGIESVGGYKDAFVGIRDRLAAEGLTRHVIPLSGRMLAGDKVARCTPIEAIVEGNRFHALRAPWNIMFMQHTSEFPNGAHDDLIDAAALAYHTAKRRMATGQQKARRYR